MNTLGIIREQDVYPAAPHIDTDGFKHRRAVRAVVFAADGRVALLNVVKQRFHKLPGGGIEEGEDKQTALAREILEEIGCTVEVTHEIGEIVEYRDQWQQKQTSYCYIAKQVGEPVATEFTEEENADGFEPYWAEDIDAAIALMQADEPTEYDGHRMKPRDLIILKAAKKFI